MTLGVGRGMDLNFATLATLLAAASDEGHFSVQRISDRTGFHPNKVKGHRSWARAMRLTEADVPTAFARELLAHDPSLVEPLSRGASFVELVSNPEAEVAHYICEVLLPHIVQDDRVITTDGIVVMLVGAHVGAQSNATGQPRRDADLFLRSLRSPQGFGALGLLRTTGTGRYGTGSQQVGPALTGYALLRRWPAGVPYLANAEARRLVAPLLLSPDRFSEDLTVLERRGLFRRVTSSGLDQVRPAGGSAAMEALWSA
jgi:hypothetical protein